MAARHDVRRHHAQPVHPVVNAVDVGQHEHRHVGRQQPHHHGREDRLRRVQLDRQAGEALEELQQAVVLINRRLRFGRRMAGPGRRLGRRADAAEELLDARELVAVQEHARRSAGTGPTIRRGVRAQLALAQRRSAGRAAESGAPRAGERLAADAVVEAQPGRPVQLPRVEPHAAAARAELDLHALELQRRHPDAALGAGAP